MRPRSTAMDRRNRRALAMPFAQMSPSAQGLRTRSQETLRVARVRSTFDAPEQQALEIVALQREKEKQDREHRDDGSRHHQLVVLHVLAREPRECDRRRLPSLVA